MRARRAVHPVRESVIPASIGLATRLPALVATRQRSRRGALLTATALVSVYWSVVANGASPPPSTLPTGGSFAAGHGSIAQSAGTLTVNQTTNRAIINWQAFSIGSGSTVTIANGSGATLNQVTGAQASQIAGRLNATGSVYLVNPNGVVIMPDGRIITGGDFLASALGPSSGAFMQGGTVVLSGSSQAAVQNGGTIIAQHGDVLLIANTVTNSGTVQASGAVDIIAARQVVLTETGEGNLVSVELPGGDISNSGAIEAARVKLSSAGGNIYALAGNNGGLIQATGTTKRGGRVWLSAGGDVDVQGTVVATGPAASPGAIGIKAGGTAAVSGVLTAGSAGGKGGKIDVNGGHVVLSGAHLNASGSAGGGTIGLGGAKNSSTAAASVRVDAGSTLLANGGTAGPGGTVSIWSTEQTDFLGL